MIDQYPSVIAFTKGYYQSQGLQVWLTCDIYQLTSYNQRSRRASYVLVTRLGNIAW